MQIVIDIPDRIYYGAKTGITVNGSDASQILIEAVANGTLLPKGRGRLLILDEKCVNANSMKIGNWSCQKWISEVGISNSVMTIIESDKEEKQNEVT